MSQSDQTNQLSAIETILDAEREIMLNGNLEDQQALSEDKDRLLGMLISRPEDKERLKRIREKAGRNASRLRAAEAGLCSASAH